MSNRPEYRWSHPSRGDPKPPQINPISGQTAQKIHIPISSSLHGSFACMLGTYWGGRRAELYALKFHGWLFGEVAVSPLPFRIVSTPPVPGVSVHSVGATHTWGLYDCSQQSGRPRQHTSCSSGADVFFRFSGFFTRNLACRSFSVSRSLFLIKRRSISGFED